MTAHAFTLLVAGDIERTLEPWIAVGRVGTYKIGATDWAIPLLIAKRGIYVEQARKGEINWAITVDELRCAELFAVITEDDWEQLPRLSDLDAWKTRLLQVVKGIPDETMLTVVEDRIEEQPGLSL